MSPPFAASGSLTTDKRQIDDAGGWDTQTDWEAFQSASNIEITNGSVQLGQVSAPAGVIHSYPVETYGASTWTDNVGTADMTVNGMTQTTFSTGDDSVSGDGSNDYGTATGPESVATDADFGIAFTIQASSLGKATYMGMQDSNMNRLRIRSDDFWGSPTGNVSLQLQDGTNQLVVETTSAIDDGSPHAVVINKSSDDPTGVEIYVDDMSTAATTANRVNEGFNSGNYSPGVSFAFFAENRSGGPVNFAPIQLGIIEFKTDTYSQSDRDNFVSRRPEV